MNLLLIHNSYRSGQTGGEDVVFEGERRALEEALGLEHVFVYSVSNDHIRPLTLLWTLWGSRFHAKAVQQLIKKHHINIVHVHNFFPLLTPSIFKAAKEAGAFVIQTLHNYRWWCLPGTLYHEKKGACRACHTAKWFWPAILGRCYGKSYLQSAIGALALSWYRWQGMNRYIDRYWALSHTQMNTLKQLGVLADKIEYKPNFVDTAAVLKIPVLDKKGYVFVGRLEKAKGIILLLEAWKKAGLQDSLTIIGAGPLLEGLKQRYQSDYIHFLGTCSRSETLQQMSRARYVFQVSLMEETFGLTMIEAMQLGTPVIGLSIGTRLEIIEQGVSGWLAEPEYLADVIVKSAVCEDEWYSRMIENAKKRSVSFEKSRVLEQQIALYRSLFQETKI